MGRLCDDEKSWPIPGKLLIDGLTYGGFCGEIRAAPIEQTASPTDTASRLKWLRLQPGFFPQPYKQLANWMRENGDDAGAFKVLAAKAAAESEASGGSLGFASLSLNGPFIAIISFALLLLMLLVLAGPDFFRRSRIPPVKEWQMLKPLRAAAEIYRPGGVAERFVGSGEREPEAPPIMQVDATMERAPVRKNPDGSGIFRREGELWVVAHRGKTFRLKDAKGIAYIAFLLAHPGKRIHVHELIARVDGVAAPGLTVVPGPPELYPTNDLGDAGEALDRHARADYRHRLRELAEELAETERLNDVGRAESIRKGTGLSEGGTIGRRGNRRSCAEGRGLCGTGPRNGQKKYPCCT